jgi:hypothetical protein
VHNQTRDKQLEELPTAATPKIKKPYVKPAFRYEKVFETQALSCGKAVNGIIPNCSVSQKTS